ncbi:hypothetical protein GCM10027040_36380 [Halomonas shantousis]
MSLPPVAILEVAEQLCGSKQLALDWYHHQNLPVFDGLVPQQLVAAGRSTDLLRYLQSLQAGATG